MAGVAITPTDLTFLPAPPSIFRLATADFRFHRVCPIYLIFRLKKPTPRPLSLSLVTHNSIFADYLNHRRFLYSPPSYIESDKSCSEIATKTVKDLPSYRGTR